MNIHIRLFQAADAEDLVEILTRNGQFGHPEIEGAAAMNRVAGCEAAVFLVADVDGRAEGLVRAVYDGSRALIHLLSVRPELQGHGIGTMLVAAVQTELRRRGAPTVSVLVNDASAGFWRKHGFETVPAYLMLKSI